MLYKINHRYIVYLEFLLLVIMFSMLTYTLFMLFSLNPDGLKSAGNFPEIEAGAAQLKLVLIIGILILSAVFLAIIFLFSKKYIITTRKTHEERYTTLQNEIEKQSKLINNLNNLYNSAIEYDTFRTEFFSNITHELKTPLSVIISAIQLIEHQQAFENKDDRKLSRQFQTVKQNCYRMLKLVNNLLDITRLDSGYMRLNLTNCNLVLFIEEIIQSVVPYAEQKNISLEFDAEEEELVTAVDTDKLERVILNLLSNAIKFTPRGGKVFIRISSSGNKARVSVKDNGIGIPVQMKDTIFERFRQVNNTLARENEGSGIGLSIVKSFIDLHNGAISVNSDINKGSEFVIELPVRLCSSKSDNGYPASVRQNKTSETINIEFSDVH